MNRNHSSAKRRGIQKEKRKSQSKLVDVSKDGKRKPESVARTSGTFEVSQRVVARNGQHGSDSDINVEGVATEQQQCREVAPGRGTNREKHEQVQSNAEVPQVLDLENGLFVTKIEVQSLCESWLQFAVFIYLASDWLSFTTQKHSRNNSVFRFLQ